MTQKNQHVYPLREQLQILIADRKTCTDFVQSQKIDEEIATIQEKFEQIEESAKTKKKIWDLRPPVHLHVLSLKEVCNNSEEQWNKL